MTGVDGFEVLPSLRVSDLCTESGLLMLQVNEGSRRGCVAKFRSSSSLSSNLISCNSANAASATAVAAAADAAAALALASAIL
jgi:hypothetical protein